MRLTRILIGIGVAILLAGILYAALERMGRDAGQHDVVDGLEAFVHSRQWRRAPRHPVVFIGIDGAAWRFIDPLIASGDLPNFARLKKEGAFASLQSLTCHFSPPAWVTMMTGYLPESTGVYTFGKWDREEHRFSAVNALDVEVPSVWDVASYAGLRVAVVNVPMTYPVHPVNGIMVSGLMTPIDVEEKIEVFPTPPGQRRAVPQDPAIESYSPVLKNSLSDRHNMFLSAFYDTDDDGVARYDKVSTTVVTSPYAGVPGQVGPITLDLGEFSPWLPILVERDGRVVPAWCKIKFAQGPEGGFQARISPTFFDITVPYVWPESLADTLRSVFSYYLPTKFVAKDLVGTMTEDAARYLQYFYDREDWDFLAYVFTQSDNIHHTAGFTPLADQVYRTIDRAIGEIMDSMPADATLIVASDHGFGEYSYGIDLNEFLHRSGLLTWLEKGKIDYAHTLVFHNLWHLYVNHDLMTREALAERGIVVADGEDPTDAFVDYLRGVVGAVPRGDGRGVVKVEIEKIAGHTAGVAPDLRVRGAYGDHIIDFWNVREPQDIPVRVLKGSERFGHTRDGIFVMWGRGAAPGRDIGDTSIENVAATMYFLMGIPIASDLDGRVIEGALSADQLARNPARTVESYAQVPREQQSEQASEDLEEKLRSLGYIR